MTNKNINERHTISETLVYLPVSELYPHPDNPRKDVGDVTELAESIKANGVLQNLTVVPRKRQMTDAEYEAACREYNENPSEETRLAINRHTVSDGYTVIIGHRRLAAATMAGLTHVPCVITEMSDKEQIQTMLLENMQRSDLTVYEQAQGFQMMLDLGATVDEIADKSGFSVKTVKRRVKMMELDQEKLREVSERQLSLSDFDTLSQIEDIKERNKCLDKIGTSEFNSSVSWAMRRQGSKKNLPAVKTWLKENGAVKLDRKYAYSSQYCGYGAASACATYIYLHEWEEARKKLPQISPKKQLYYILDEDTVRLYQKAEKKKPEKKPASVLEREKAVREAWKALEDAQSVAHGLRKQFVEKLTVTSKNRTEILKGAIYAAVLEAVDYNSPDRVALCQLLNIENGVYGKERGIQLMAGIEQMQDKNLAQIVYSCFGDDEKTSCTGSAYKANFPEYELSTKLKLVYNWLASLGYEMSEEETALLKGNHEAYKAGEVYEAGAKNE